MKSETRSVILSTAISLGLIVSYAIISNTALANSNLQSQGRLEYTNPETGDTIVIDTSDHELIQTTLTTNQAELASLKQQVKDLQAKVILQPTGQTELVPELIDAPVGHILSYMGTKAPENYLVCDGSEYNIADYPQLATQIEENFGKPNHFGGDGITTFKVPNLTNKFLKGTLEAGIDEEAGLPNITGSMYVTGNGSHGSNMSAWGDGAFYSIHRSGYRDAYTDGSNTNASYYVGLNAARSSAVYGKSDTVTPENTSVLFCIKAKPTYYIIYEEQHS